MKNDAGNQRARTQIDISEAKSARNQRDHIADAQNTEVMVLVVSQNKEECGDTDGPNAAKILLQSGLAIPSKKQFFDHRLKSEARHGHEQPKRHRPIFPQQQPEGRALAERNELPGNPKQFYRKGNEREGHQAQRDEIRDGLPCHRYSVVSWTKPAAPPANRKCQQQQTTILNRLGLKENDA